MTTAQRRAFGALLVELRLGRFEGNKKAAYNAAKVNAATWERAETGQSIKEHTLSKIVNALFPQTGGDWEKLLDDRGNFHLDYWARTGRSPEDPDILEYVMGVGDDPDATEVTSWETANVELRRLRRVIAVMDYRIGKLQEATGVDPFADWSITTQDPAEQDPRRGNYFLVVEDSDQQVAAHDEEHSIESEQGHDETP